MFGVHDKPFEYNSPPSPPRRWSGGTLVPPWTCPIPIDPPQMPVFDQPGLSQSLSCGFAAVQRCSGLDVRCWMLDVQPTDSLKHAFEYHDQAAAIFSEG